MERMKTGTAGREKPQDCVVTVTLGACRGVKVNLNSKMEKMFGKAIVKAAKDAAKELCVKSAEITIDDYGSLDFVIRARTKTAINRARGDDNE